MGSWLLQPIKYGRYKVTQVSLKPIVRKMHQQSVGQLIAILLLARSLSIDDGTGSIVN